MLTRASRAGSSCSQSGLGLFRPAPAGPGPTVSSRPIISAPVGRSGRTLNGRPWTFRGIGQGDVRRLRPVGTCPSRPGFITCGPGPVQRASPSTTFQLPGMGGGGGWTLVVCAYVRSVLTCAESSKRVGPGGVSAEAATPNGDWGGEAGGDGGPIDGAGRGVGRRCSGVGVTRIGRGAWRRRGGRWRRPWLMTRCWAMFPRDTLLARHLAGLQ